MPDQIKALTLHQPWATLMAMGLKKIETRPWSTHYHGLLAIHAAAVIPAYARAELVGFRDLLGGVKIPLGCVVGVCNLVECVSTKTLLERYELSAIMGKAGFDPIEARLGNYEPGRYAWITSHMIAFPNPIPAKGYQRLWTWTVPEDGEPQIPGSFTGR